MRAGARVGGAYGREWRRGSRGEAEGRACCRPTRERLFARPAAAQENPTPPPPATQGACRSTLPPPRARTAALVLGVLPLGLRVHLVQEELGRHAVRPPRTQPPAPGDADVGHVGRVRALACCGRRAERVRSAVAQQLRLVLSAFLVALALLAGLGDERRLRARAPRAKVGGPVGGALAAGPQRLEARLAAAQPRAGCLLLAQLRRGVGGT